jgi:hypothetical protein
MFERLHGRWAAEARLVIEAERGRRFPPEYVGEQIREGVRERLSHLPASSLPRQPRRIGIVSVPRIAPLSSPRARPAGRHWWPWRTRRLRLVRKAAAGTLVASLLAFAPFALAGLGSASLLVVGGYLVTHPSALQSLAMWHPSWSKVAERSSTRQVEPGAGLPRVEDPHPVDAPLPSLPPAFPVTVAPLVETTAHNGTPRRHPTRAVRAPPPPVPPVPTVATGGTNEVMERNLLEQARVAIKAGQTSDALKRLAEAAKAPHDSLSEERELLTVLALVHSGKTTEAKQHLSNFAARYPQSIYLHRLSMEVGTVREGATE